MRRPAAVLTRQTGGRAFGEDVTLEMVTVSRNQYGEPVAAAPTQTSIKAATAPGIGGNALVRELTEGGTRLHAIRMFWTSQSITPGAEDGDILIYKGIRWRARGVQPWDGMMWEIAAVREEPQ